jgi:hypothetical protein
VPGNFDQVLITIERAATEGVFLTMPADGNAVERAQDQIHTSYFVLEKQSVFALPQV